MILRLLLLQLAALLASAALETQDHGILRSRRDNDDRPDHVENVDITQDQHNKTIHDSNGNVTRLESDQHKYYESRTIDYGLVWVELDSRPSTDHPMLSMSYRRAATIELNFSFPFYGHAVRNVTIATGGFLFLGQYVHAWLAATQYIAPLMANFDTSKDNSSRIRYLDNGTALVVEWKNVHLQGPEAWNGTAAQFLEPFTFQAILHKNGDIAFAYQSIPVNINTITDAQHPVKVGLSDAYIIDSAILFVRRKTIYEYHRVNLKRAPISNRTAIYFKALATCNIMKSCSECLSDTRLKCKWCPRLGHCSDGLDRHRQDWLKFQCDTDSIDDRRNCSTAVVRDYNINDAVARAKEALKGDESSEQSSQSDTQQAHTGIITVMIVVVFVVATASAWVCYAYFLPHTWSGQLLIKYRPSRWQWLRSEPRYTAASIHIQEIYSDSRRKQCYMTTMNPRKRGASARDSSPAYSPSSVSQPS